MPLVQKKAIFPLLTPLGLGSSSLTFRTLFFPNVGLFPVTFFPGVEGDKIIRLLPSPGGRALRELPGLFYVSPFGEMVLLLGGDAGKMPGYFGPGLHRLQFQLTFVLPALGP